MFFVVASAPRRRLWSAEGAEGRRGVVFSC